MSKKRKREKTGEAARIAEIKRMIWEDTETPYHKKKQLIAELEREQD